MTVEIRLGPEWGISTWHRWLDSAGAKLGSDYHWSWDPVGQCWSAVFSDSAAATAVALKLPWSDR
jgi:hypothetical protein